TRSACPTFFLTTASTDVDSLSLHDALPISCAPQVVNRNIWVLFDDGADNIIDEYSTLATAVDMDAQPPPLPDPASIELDGAENRSEEHTSELQSRENLVCRLLLEKKKQGPT